MQVLLYDAIDLKKIKGFAKFCQSVETENFAQADIKKVGDNLYRAKLTQKERLLFSFYQYQQIRYCLVLEYLPNHAYEKSRFLAGKTVDEDKLPPIIAAESVLQELVYLNPNHNRFHYLNKVLSFDDTQQAIYHAPLPAVIIGSAGSGKTALVLEKMKQGFGDVLYVSLSPYLVQHSRHLYYANAYHNELQEELSFLSFQEYLETLQVPLGKESTPREFHHWFSRQAINQGLKREGQKIFEEFRGVITGYSLDSPYLSRDEYMQLGVKQSLFASHERDSVYSLFERYMVFLKEQQQYDTNIISQQYLSLVTPKYDFVVVDEVQDLTNVQLTLILLSLKQGGEFILCGDANQIVHPNFFSWSKLKSLFFDGEKIKNNHNLLHILSANYRNSSLVTNVANRILKLKHARFGSVDKESNYLVQSVGEQQGTLQLLAARDEVIKQLDSSTSCSTKFAVLVLHPEQKAEAASRFSTPLVFSIQEAKGLEYENIILYNFVSSETRAFRNISANVSAQDLDVNNLNFSRAKSKLDKSLEIYKFYINSLYVAVTRAVSNLYIVESNLDHPLFTLLDLERFIGELSLTVQKSSLQEWQQEAQRLEMQGKQEQAEAIRNHVLKQQAVPWKCITPARWQEIQAEFADSETKKQQLLAMEYALLHQDYVMLRKLAEQQFKPAVQWDDDVTNEAKLLKMLYKNHYIFYDVANPNGVLRDIEKYGISHRTRFNMTPLMISALIGNTEAVNAIAALGADLHLLANNGLNAWQLALGRGLEDKTFIKKLESMYSALAPETISIQVDGKLEKLDELTMYGFLFNVFFALWYRKIGGFIGCGHGIAVSAVYLEELLVNLPDSILSPMKKKRGYISRYLSSNERDRDAPRNKKLFKRLKRGQYVLNPALKIRVGDEWHKLHQLLSLDIGFGWRLSNITIKDNRYLHYKKIIDENLRNFIDDVNKETG